MKHLLVWRPFAGGVAAILLAGCAGAPSQSDGGVSVVLSVDRTTVTTSTPVQLTITTTNRGTTPAEIVDPRSYACPRPYGVVNAAGNAVPLPTRVCAAIAFTPRLLQPGESVSVTDQWSGDQSDGAFGAVPVAPGAYQLTARLAPQQQLLVSSPVTVSVPAR